MHAQENMLNNNSKIYVAGHRGLVGSALVRKLTSIGCTNLLTRTSAELDLRDTVAVNNFFATNKPEFVFLVAAKVGGIVANATYPADFIYDNLMIQNNIIHAAYKHGVTKLLFVGSSCIYPRECPQPIKEEYLLTGPLEKTNEPYALAKITGIKMCQSYNKQYGTNFITCMPTNLYGPNDNFHPNNSHVIPGLIHKIYQAKQTGAQEVVIWGTGTPRREFLFVDDLAEALVHLMQHYNGSEWLNVGTGTDVTIAEVAQLIKDEIGFEGKIVYDASKPDGTPRKVLDVNKINALGWQARTSLQDGIKQAVDWYVKQQ